LVGQLRAYGSAIVPFLAARFIRAYMELKHDCEELRALWARIERLREAERSSFGEHVRRRLQTSDGG
jgi:hypothetical protein